ncbi:hypothetical protein EJB05_48491, partial [Eragrostis curvula]
MSSRIDLFSPRNTGLMAELESESRKLRQALLSEVLTEQRRVGAVGDFDEEVRAPGESSWRMRQWTSGTFPSCGSGGTRRRPASMDRTVVAALT